MPKIEEEGGIALSALISAAGVKKYSDKVDIDNDDDSDEAVDEVELEGVPDPGDMAYGRRNFIAYQRAGGAGTFLPSTRQRLSRYRKIITVILLVTVIYTAFLYRSGGARSFLTNPFMSSNKQLAISSWNIAAINNNPFEYWITYKENPKYEKLMVDIENFIEDPGDKDIKVYKVFTDEMFDELDKSLTKTAGWGSVREYWENDFKNRRIMKNFMKDPLLGSKRLASMPDRITNTIFPEGSTEPVLRPTVINMYEKDLSTMKKWWKSWKTFMFDTEVKIKNKEGVVEKKFIYQMLQPISKAKYPDITEEEAKDSLPLQTLCGAIFDAILVHMMNTVEDPDVWQPLKRTMVEALNKKKVPNTLKILENTYGDADIITLQEVSSSFIDQARGGNLGKIYHIVSPANIDTTRDQNSVIFLNRNTFPSGSSGEITSKVEAAFPAGEQVPVAPGDILAITTTSKNGSNYVIASFHGDTNGLATKPVLDAIVKAMEDDPKLSKDHHLIFGLDANTYEHATPKKQEDVMDFGERFAHHGLTSAWGDVPQPSNYTTYNARTYLQPQLNKACKQSEKREKGDVNPKDFILFSKQDFKVVRTWKDNTGHKDYIEDMAFPTLNFPSDHGILSTIIEVVDESAVI